MTKGHGLSFNLRDVRQGARDALAASDKSWKIGGNKISVPTYELVQAYGRYKLKGRRKWLKEQKTNCIRIMEDSSLCFDEQE